LKGGINQELSEDAVIEKVIKIVFQMAISYNMLKIMGQMKHL
jgi:hypothetical protein